MPKTKEDTPQAELEKGSEKKESTSTAALDVLDGERYIRTYSRSVHGDAYKDFAEMFAGKVKTRTVVASDKVKRLEVRYREESREIPGIFVNKKEFFSADSSGAAFKEAAIEFALLKKGVIVVV